MAKNPRKRGRPPAPGIVTYCRLPVDVWDAITAKARRESRSISGEMERAARAHCGLPVPR